jgi:rod shape-determining protein MreC
MRKLKMAEKSENWITMLAASLTFVAFLVLAGGARFPAATKKFDNLGNFVFAPFQKMLVYVGYYAQDLTSYFSSVKKLRCENERLTSELESKNLAIDRTKSLILENDTLKKMLEIKKDSADFHFEYADVIARSPQNFYKTFTINKGESSGIRANQTVVASDSSLKLIGKVSETGASYARVKTIFDENTSVGARVVRSLEPGILEGFLRQGEALCKMTTNSNGADIAEGDFVETLGGEIYPKGILIGTVLEANQKSAGMERKIIVRPAADFDKIYSVFIMKD